MLCLLTGEADIVTLHVQKLVDSGLGVEDIAVIAPYNLQVCFETSVLLFPVCSAFEAGGGGLPLEIQS